MRSMIWNLAVTEPNKGQTELAKTERQCPSRALYTKAQMQGQEILSPFSSSLCCAHLMFGGCAFSRSSTLASHFGTTLKRWPNCILKPFFTRCCEDPWLKQQQAHQMTNDIFVNFFLLYGPLTTDGVLGAISNFPRPPPVWSPTGEDLAVFRPAWVG